MDGRGETRGRWQWSIRASGVMLSREAVAVIHPAR